MHSNEEFEERRSERIKRRLKELCLTLIAAIVFGFLVGILAGVLVNVLMGASLTATLILVTVLGFLALVGIAYLIFYFYAFSPNTRMVKKVKVPILYNRKEGKVIDDPFDGYYPQKIAWQAFEKIIETNSHYKARLKKAISPEAKEKHIMTEFFEYLLIWTLGRELHSFNTKGSMPDKKLELPRELKKQCFHIVFPET